MTLTSAPPAAPPRAAGVILALTCAAPLLVLINYTAPMVTLPDTAAALGAGVTGPAWILNGISLGLSALLLVAGSLADDYGRRRVYVLGMWVLAASSVLVAVAVNTPTFVAGRLLQGAASAAVLAASLGILGHSTPSGPARLRATGRYGATLGLGIAVGPLLSGWGATVGSWRAVYWAVAAGAVILAVAARLLPESRAERARRLDVPGVLTLALGVAALLAAITEGRTGWTRPIVVAFFAAAAVLLVAFVVVERRRAEPMIDLGLFRRPMFLVSTGGALVTGIAVIGLMSYMPTVLTLAHDMTSVTAAALFSVWSGTSFLTALLNRHLRMGSRVRLALGLILSAAGTLPLLGVADHLSYGRVLPGLFVAGIGSGLINASLTHLAIESVPAHRVGMGSGAGNTARYIGSAVGVAVTVTVAGVFGLSAGTDVTVVAYAVVAVAAALLALAARTA
ncbi:MFS transporter [Microtetraspora sp. NBRC 13810]|uniref:MFS transporter n=1 Tax=Microtetraspora sp. NBRC 13810 TaxID=3030990 RepID=UPI0024A2909D|nr:MFS transporter [Microtetraspora sp. NBRC 13810]GLW07982.1 MFS transporter [Microtetraspora sp. NBRC 13810]